MSTYAGIPLLIGSEEAESRARARLPSPLVHPEPWASHALDVPVGSWVYPWGACRWSEARYLVNRPRLDAICQAVYQGGGYTDAVLRVEDAGRSVESRMWMLTPRPLSTPQGDGLWLLTLVDSRYWWWLRTTGQTTSQATWAAVVSQLASQLGETLTIGDVPAAIGSVPSGYWDYEERLPPVLDRLCDSLQARLVRNLDGTFRIQQAPEGRLAVQGNLARVARVTAGGPFRLDPLTPPDDLPTQHPRSLRLTFPVKADNTPSRSSLGVVVSLSELGLAALGDRVKQETATFPASAFASYTSGVLTNRAELTAMARAWASAWYTWRLSGHDLDYAGVMPWTPEGASRIEWREGTTRVQSEHGGGDDTLALSSSAGSNYLSTGSAVYYGGSQVWDHVDLTFLGGSDHQAYYQIGVGLCSWWSWCFSSLTLTWGGTNNNVTIPAKPALTVTTTTGTTTTVTGLVPQTGTDGTATSQVVTLINDGTGKLRIDDQSSSSTITNRIILPGSSSLWVGPGESATFFYDTTAQRWRLIDSTALTIRTDTSTLTTVPSTGVVIQQGITTYAPVIGSAKTIPGFVGIPVGASLLVVNPNSNSYDLTLTNGDTGPSSGDRFDFSTGSDIVLTPGSSLLVTNDGTKLIDSSASLSIATSATGSGPTWTVTSVKTSNYTAAVGELVLLDSSGGSFTVTLPPAAGNSGKSIAFKHTVSTLNTVTIDGNGTETIDGSLTTGLTSSPTRASVVVVCDGSNWWLVPKVV